MKTLRRSLNSSKDQHPNISAPVPVPQLQRPAAAVAPPKKVIKATDSYRNQAPQELSFLKGDFFYVTKDPEPNDEWYQVHNPVSGARGIVPRAMFEEFDKSNAAARVLGRSGSQSSTTSAQVKPKSTAWYAVVLHDFTPERPDELDAKAGDPLTIVAQSNREWFVAKPIGRLGRPGLIPASFVEIRDPVTNQAVADIDILMDRGELPRVEDWKRSVMSYKASTIPLGVLDDGTNAAVPNSPFMPSTPTIQAAAMSPTFASSSPPLLAGASRLPSPQPPFTAPPLELQQTSSPPGPLPSGRLVSAEVVSFHYEADEWWFRVNAVFQPRGPSGSGSAVPQARQLVLYRVYNDFYDFQVELLQLFPREAGREPPHPRILPYMPGPVEHVTQDITNARRRELDEYLALLCDLDKHEAGYMLEHQHVLDFISPKPGDLDTPCEPDGDRDIQPQRQKQPSPGPLRQDNYGYDAGYGGPGSSRYSNEPEDLDPLADDDYGDEPAQSMERLRMDGRRSDGSQYAEEGENQYDGDGYLNGGRGLQAQNHDRSDSAVSYSHKYAPSPVPGGRSPVPDAGYAQHPMRSSQVSLASAFESSPRLEPMSYPTTPASAGARSNYSGSNANANAPPISASNSATAFIKIKIYDRVSDDLIAIRVSPRVTHAQLLEKVKARLGAEIQELKYRDSLQNGFVNIRDDRGLQQWLESTDKHVLYAD